MRDTDLSRIAIQAAYEAGADETPYPAQFPDRPPDLRAWFREDRPDHPDGRPRLRVALRHQVHGLPELPTYRTLIAGRKPNQKEKDMYQSLLDRLDAVIDAIKPGGATTADAAKYFPPATKWGYKDEAELLTMEIGHGLGALRVRPPGHQPPVVSGAPPGFRAGMVLAVESREGEIATGGVRLENMLVVTEDGAEIIDHMPRDRIIEPTYCWG